MVMEGVKVGTGAIIATRAVVTRDVPPYAIVAGTPAQVIRYRHPPEIIEGLLASRWWELDSAFLTGLPLDRPREFLAALEAREAPRAAYRRMTITRQGAGWIERAHRQAHRARRWGALHVPDCHRRVFPAALSWCLTSARRRPCQS